MPDPWNWDCNDPRKGCWRLLCVPRFAILDAYLPGTLRFSDVDGSTERNGYFLQFEFKHRPVDIPVGQRLAMERAPPEVWSIGLVIPDMQTMVPTHVRFVVGGELGPWRPATAEFLKHLIERWEAWARRQVPAWEARRRRITTPRPDQWQTPRLVRGEEAA